MSAAIGAFVLVALPAARADCIDDAARRHQVSGVVLRAIGWHESGLRPTAIGRNTNGTMDIGAFQINDVHLPELARQGIAVASLFDGCVSADVAAWHYRRQVERFGNTWVAVGAYHSGTPARGAWYANQIAQVLMGWQSMPAGPLPFDARESLGPARRVVQKAVGTRRGPEADPGQLAVPRAPLQDVASTPSRPPCTADRRACDEASMPAPLRHADSSDVAVAVAVAVPDTRFDVLDYLPSPP